MVATAPSIMLLLTIAGVASAAKCEDKIKKAVDGDWCRVALLTGYCTPKGPRYNAQVAKVICPLTCGTCPGSKPPAIDACQDVSLICEVLVKAKFCNPKTPLGSVDIPNIFCRKSCGTCKSGTKSPPPAKKPPPALEPPTRKPPPRKAPTKTPPTKGRM